MERYSRNRIDMRYGSPDAIRPNPDLIRQTRENFNRKNTPRGPSPSHLPMPSERLLTRRKSSSKSLSPIVIQGKNRKWTIKTKRSSRPRTNSESRERVKGRVKGKKKHKRNKP